MPAGSTVTAMTVDPGHPVSRILVVEDDNAIGRHLQSGLTTNGYTVTWTRGGRSAIAAATLVPPDIVLLDLGLPDIDGIEVARELRADHPDVLIVILTARSDDIDIVVGLDAGADDYLVKPFTLAVLLARLRAHRRRPSVGATGIRTMIVGDLVIDVAARECRLAGAAVALRLKEFELIVALARRAGEVISREDLMRQVWDENWFGSTKVLDVTIAALRKRLSITAEQQGSPHPPTITTFRGAGYRLDLPDAAD